MGVERIDVGVPDANHKTASTCLSFECGRRFVLHCKPRQLRSVGAAVSQNFEGYTESDIVGVLRSLRKLAATPTAAASTAAAASCPAAGARRDLTN